MKTGKKGVSTAIIAAVVVVVIVVAAVAAIELAPSSTKTVTSTVTASMSQTSSTMPSSSIKMAVLLGGDATDDGLNANGIDVANWVHATYGWNVSISQDVAYSDQNTIMTSYVQEGYNVIWTDGNQFIGSTEAIAAQNPNVDFIMTPTYTGDNITKNLVAISAGYQATGYYLAGVLAGKMTKTNALGVILGQWVAATALEFYAFAAGVNSSNPQAQVYLTVPGTWSDPTIGYTDATTMINTDHVDILVPIADATGRGAIAAATVQNVTLIGTVEDQVALAPNVMMTSVLLNTTAFIQTVVEHINAGTFSQIGGQIINMNLGSLSPYHAYDSVIPTSVKALVNSTAAGINSGSIQVPFTYTANPPATPMP
ncbi:MAG TPA: BMP family ABC transporter substrate-binding protein [Nitrososphaerales archaeon]|nr:BMP family ABC transporter substrate-binding protein [Nitrososphaerales archaeon]